MTIVPTRGSPHWIITAAANCVQTPPRASFATHTPEAAAGEQRRPFADPLRDPCRCAGAGRLDLEKTLRPRRGS